MNLRNAAGGLTSRFAHLAGLKPARTTASVTASDDDKDEKDKAKAEDEDDKDKPGEDEDDKSARAEEDDKEPEDDDDKKDEAKAAASAERARCAAIFATPEAAANLSLAAHLAFETDLTAKQAVGALRAGGVTAAAEHPRRSSLSERMERAPKADVGPGENAGPDMSTAAGVAAFILGAGRPVKKEG